MSAITRFLRNKRKKQALNLEDHSKLYQTVNNVGTFGSFTAIAIVVMGWFDVIKMSTFMSGLIVTIAIISIGCLMISPWLRHYKKGQNKNIAIVFMSLVAICTIMWLICSYIIINLSHTSKFKALDVNEILAPLNFIKITLIITLQFSIASLIANTIIKYRKEIIVLQVITYISNFFFDLYLTCFLLCIKISPTEGLEISKNISFLFAKPAYVLFFISVIYMLLSSKIMKTVESRRISGITAEKYNADALEPLKSTHTQELTLEDRLASLQSMLDKKLITQEEFDEKRKEILKDL